MATDENKTPFRLRKDSFSTGTSIPSFREYLSYPCNWQELHFEYIQSRTILQINKSDRVIFKKKKLLEIRGKVIPNNFDTQVTLIIHPFFSFTRDNIYNRACARRRLCQRDNEALHKGGGKSARALQLKWMRACMRYARVREASGSKIYRGNDIVIYRYITRYGPLPWCYGLNWKSKLEEDWICLRMETCSR